MGTINFLDLNMQMKSIYRKILELRVDGRLGIPKELFINPVSATPLLIRTTLTVYLRRQERSKNEKLSQTHE